MQTAIVIVSFNGRKWLDKCLKSCQICAPAVPIYVVDNASTDGSAELAQTYSEVTVIKQVFNEGFAGGNNVGISAALKDGAEAVMLLNQDAELTAGCVNNLLEYLSNHPQVGAVQPAILLPDGRVNSLGNSFHFLGFGEAGGNGLEVTKAMNKLSWLATDTEPPYLSGAAVLIRAQALRQVGFFKNELFMYHEDLDLSLRLRAAGWKLAILPTSKVIHFYESNRSLRQYYYMERNRLVVWNEIFSLKTLLLFLPFFIFSEIALLLMAASQGWFKEKIKSYRYFLLPSSWLSIAAHRRQFKKIRRVSDRKLLSYAASRIEYQSEGTGKLTTLIWNPLSFLGWKIIYPLLRW